MASLTWICTFFMATLHLTNGLQNENEIILKSGEDIELSCEDSAPVHWCYPPKYDSASSQQNDKYNLQTSETESSGMKYKITLRIEKATPVYTGYYHCVRNDSNARCVKQMTSVNSTYIYVHDSESLLVERGTVNVYAYSNEAVTLPCLPTHPDVKIQLYKGSGEPVELGKQEDSDMTVTYDRTVGFILDPFGIQFGKILICEAKKNEQSDLLQCQVHFNSKQTHLHDPTILRNSSPVKSEIIAREGSTLQLVCQSRQKQTMAVTMEWNIPNHSKKFTRSLRCKYTYCKETLLTVNNISYADAGDYSCTLKTHNQESKVETRKLQVIGQNVTGVRVSSSWNSSIPVSVKDKLTIVLEYLAPENISVTWYGPDVKPLHENPSKYQIQITSKQIVLYVMNVTPQDAGNYSAQIFDNSMMAVWYNICVIIADKPQVYLESPSILFNPGRNVTFYCKVYSIAPVDLKWSFTKCNLTLDNSCHGGHAVVLNKTSINIFARVYVLTVTLNIKEEGILGCSANNTCKNKCGSTNTSQKIFLTELEELNETLTITDEPEEVVVGSKLTLSCAASTYFHHDYPHWELFDAKLSNTKILSDSPGISINRSRNQYTLFTNVTFLNVSRQLHEQLVICNSQNSSDSGDVSFYFNVQDPEAPRISKSNLDKDIEVKMAEIITLYCKTTGVPKPKLKWFQDGNPLVNNNLIRINEKNQSMTIRTVMAEHDGVYLCQAESSTGSASRQAKLTVTDKPGPISVGLLVTILVLTPVVLGLLVLLIIKIRRERKLLREHNLAGLANFEKGAMENINPELPVDEQADLLPYDRTWEFPVERLKLGKMLGAGAFGVVMRAEATGILEDEENTTVAVKMVKSGADRSYIKALASELKIMTHLGKHLNVVNLLGASTKRLNKMELMVIVEFCRFGNLHNYLIRHRDEFVDQLDHKTGEINLAIGMDKLSRSQSVKSKTNLKHRLLSYSSSLIGASTSQGSNTELRAPASPGVASDMSVVSSPNGYVEECLLSSGSGDQPEWRVKYSGDYVDSSINICTQNLVCWAFQIARGMEYLASRKVLHGDLAARNVLLADNNVVKICDFGLAKSMYKSDNYKKKGGGPLPIKWMALESIRDRIFSTQSDIWSFGVVLWELFSLARTPYPGMEANERLLEKLVNGYRMEKPSYSPDAIYKTMLKCWQERPNNRPCFTELVEELGALLDNNLRRHFEELNDPYVDMNEQRQSVNDYLSMMGSPNYRNLMSPSATDQHYVNSAHASGSEYLNMKSPTSPESTDGSVFEYPAENTSESGYLRMSMKDDIFSPRQMDENPFKFASSSPKKEAYAMKSMPSSNISDYINIGNSISNPTYVTSQPGNN